MGSLKCLSWMPPHLQKILSSNFRNPIQQSSSLLSFVCQKTLRHFCSGCQQQTIPDHIQIPSYIFKDVLRPKSIDIKTKEQIKTMKLSCKLAASILRYVETQIEAGLTTADIDAMVHQQCIEAGAYPSPLKYKGFPKSVCTSVNHVACHGIPGPLVLCDGDIINVDITVFYRGYHGDTSATFIIGDADARAQLLVETAKSCRDAGIDVCKDGALFSDIGEAVYLKAVEAGFQVIPNFCGHGIGQYFHGPPDIVHVPSDCGTHGKMKAGMTFTVEPIICEGSPEIEVLSDEWTAVTVDNSRSAQFEHTILVTLDGYEILTN